MPDLGLMGLTVLLVSVTIGAAGYLMFGRSADQRRTSSRLRELSEGAPASPPATRGWCFSALGSLGSLGELSQKARTNARTQLLRAGYFQPSAPGMFLGGRLLLALLLTLVCGTASLVLVGVGPFRTMPTWALVALSSLVGLNAGLFVPSFWLSRQVQARQRCLRCALPDALDMLVLCLEGGASVNAAVQRVTDELQIVHPVLGTELHIVQQEILLGLSAGDALRKFADRCGLTDVRDLAMVLVQSERFGASVTKALRCYADSVRQQRQQEAEERAQKASVLIVFPTLLCIFPAVFIVVLGPAATQLSGLFAR